MKDRYAVEVRKLSLKVRDQDAHIDILNARVADLKKTVRHCNETVERKNANILKLEDFVGFAMEYYPGCVEQYYAIKKLEGTK
jgi:hypothetical protein